MTLRLFSALLLAALLSAPVASLPAVAAPVPVRIATQARRVYVTQTGKKYHRARCAYLRGGGIPISRRRAVALGYLACRVCRP